MSTRRIAASSLKDLETLRYQGIAATDGYAQLRAAAASISPEHALLFAEPMHDASRLSTDWYTTAEGDILALADLPPEKREWTLARVAKLADGIKALAEQLKSSNEGPKVLRGNVLDLALRFPDSSHIYLVGSQPVVTCWGFASALAGVAPENMIRAGAARPAPAKQEESAPPAGPEPAVVAAAGGFSWWRALLYLLLGLLLLAGILFGLALLFGPAGCAPESLRRHVPESWLAQMPDAGCAKKPETAAVPVPPEILAVLEQDRQKEDELRRNIDRLRLQLNERAALCVRKAPEPPVVPAPNAEPKPEAKLELKLEPKPELMPGPKSRPDPVVETPPQQDPEEPPSMADLLPSYPDPVEDAPKPGEDLSIPDQAKQNNDLSFLEGCWDSDSGLIASDTGKPIDVRYCFDKNGRGSREIKTHDGRRCTGTARARFDGSGKLILDVDRAECAKRAPFAPQKVECTQGEDNKATCQGREQGDKRDTWKNSFRRSQKD